jgi:hypothetical protein
MNGPRIATCDIETAPLESYHWGLFDQNIGLEQIKVDWSILAYCFKWLNDPKPVYADTGGRGKKHVRNDKPLLKGLWELLDATDILIVQNGARFDVPKINSRLFAEGYGPYSPIRIIDTLTVNKRYFGHTSNKLAWVSKYTDQKKSEHRKFPGFDLWLQCLADNPEAWAEMRDYNIKDVLATEQLYLKQRPWIANHPNLNVYHETLGNCPKCHSSNIQKRGICVTNTGKHARYQCQDCGGWSRGKTKLPAINKEALV